MDMDNFYLSRVRRLVRFAYKYSQFYRKKYKHYKFKPDDLKKIDDVLKIPIVTRQELSRNFTNVVTQPYENFLEKMPHKSDSLPKVFLSPTERIRRYFIFIRTIRKLGYAPLLKTMIYSHHKFEKTLFNSLGLFKFEEIDPRLSVIQQLKLLRLSKPQQLIYNPLSLFEICKLIEEKNEQIPKFRFLVTQAEILPNFVKTKIESYFGDINDVYAASEIGYIAWKKHDTDLYQINYDSVFLEALKHNSELPVETEKDYGRCIVTSLVNYAFPLIRYDIDDIIRVVPNDCYAIKIKSIEGKYTDAFILNKKTVSPLTFSNTMLEHIKDLFTVVAGKKKIAIFVRPNAKLELHVIRRLLSKFFPSRNINIIKCKNIPKAVTGKYNLIIRKLR